MVSETYVRNIKMHFFFKPKHSSFGALMLGGRITFNAVAPHKADKGLPPLRLASGICLIVFS